MVVKSNATNTGGCKACIIDKYMCSMIIAERLLKICVCSAVPSLQITEALHGPIHGGGHYEVVQPSALPLCRIYYSLHTCLGFQQVCNW